MEQLSYTIEDRIIAELLGRQNFTTDESAVLELVKNAYDAAAQRVIITFESDKITIDDDGAGMNSDDIKRYWMHVGESPKGYEIADNGKKRVLAGSKGIGRFAIVRLGGYAEVISRKEGSNGICWRTDWNTSELGEAEKESFGTTILITELSEKWTTKKIEGLLGFLSKTYCETSMRIVVRYTYKDQLTEKEVSTYLKAPKLGINCTSVINLSYIAKTQRILVEIQSDEFLPEANKYINPLETNINYYAYDFSAFDELKSEPEIDLSEADLLKALEILGDFNAEFQFFVKPTSIDMEKFLYKYSRIPESFSSGIILYRNAFSISSYEGKKDWLELGKRARKSPASPSHETGAWRVRDNQLNGKVNIDKKKNAILQELSNRQGLVENVYYQLFVDIIYIGLKCFERYRQNIVRSINKKNKTLSIEVETPVIDKIIHNPKIIVGMGAREQKQLRQELLDLQKAEKNNIKEKEDVEKRYKYDVRILNVLATIGLKASSISHSMNNDRNAFSESVDDIIAALKEYGMWEELCSPEKTQKEYKNVPSLLKTNQRVGKKVLSFMDVMLTEIEKSQFEPGTYNLRDQIEIITKKWEKEYAWINILNDVEDVEFYIAEDILQVIFDNLILNSIQQNEGMNHLDIKISMRKSGDQLEFQYQDMGKGLDKKYQKSPRAILEVHETSRKKGHGLGMWILNNTVVLSGGEVGEISCPPGFSIYFTIGGSINGKV